MSKPLPVTLDLTNRSVIVVGGGRIAEKRVNTLVESGVIPTLISPELTGHLSKLRKSQMIKWEKKTFESQDLSDAGLIVIATNHEEVNQAVREAAPHGALINDASNAEKGNVMIPAQVNRGRLCISISTNGASPYLSRQIKADLEKQYDEKYEEYVDFLYEARQLIKKSLLSKEMQRSLLKELLADQFFLKEYQRKLLDWLQALC